jgi:hypothetical protein
MDHGIVAGGERISSGPMVSPTERGTEEGQLSLPTGSGRRLSYAAVTINR